MRLPPRHREKVFGTGRTLALDRNAKVRVMAYARAWNARNKQNGQHQGPITWAALRVLKALLWGFHNSHSGVCFPSYETIAGKADCARSTVAEALKALEWAGVLTWQHRLVRIRERCRDRFGHDGWRSRVIRTSNAYVFRDPQATVSAGIPSKSEKPTGTPNQDDSPLPSVRAAPPKACRQEGVVALEVLPHQRQTTLRALEAIMQQRMKALGLA